LATSDFIPSGDGKFAHPLRNEIKTMARSKESLLAISIDKFDERKFAAIKPRAN